MRVKKLKKTPSSNTLHSAYANSPSLLNGSGDSVSISAGSGARGSASHLNLPSPPQSRSSSAEGSYSTTATTFEDIDEVNDRGREVTRDGREAGKRLSKEAKGNVIVSVRVRPDDAGDSKSEGEWMVDGRRSLVAFRGREGGDYYYGELGYRGTIGANADKNLDNVFATHDNNDKVYEACAKRLVRRVMEGYHGTVFAYGMTGTGKTFSMQGTGSSPGVIPKAITDIFSFIRETPHREFLLRASYLEIYNEEIRDLLAQRVAPGVGSAQPEKIKLREDSKRGVYATPLREEIVQSPMQLLRVIARGDKARHTGTTQYNLHSSRSHAVVKIVVESRDRADGNGVKDKRAGIAPGGVRVSTLSLIDLAGSEKAADSKERRTEGAHINKSLLTLGTVIARLSGEKDKNGSPTEKDGKHLPYRDSKLTRLLQPALSGNSLVSILCTIQIGSIGSSAVANNHTGETLNTLKFAARAKNNIVSHAKRAEEALGAGGDGASRGLLERYRLEIQSLRGQLDTQAKIMTEKEEKQMEKEAVERHQDQLLEMQLARTALKERIEHLNRLILSSKSQGVNSSSSYSALAIRPQGRFNAPNDTGIRSIRSSASASTIHRTASGASTATMSTHIVSLRSPQSGQEASPINLDEEDEDDTIGNGHASLKAQNRALQSDVADKNRYISTLEKRLLQARRSSHSRVSNGFSLATLQEKDGEIAELQLRLDESAETIASLRAEVARAKAEHGAASCSSPVSPSSRDHHPKGSYGSIATTTSASLSPIDLSRKSPLELLASPSKQTATESASPRDGDERRASRKSIDGLSRMLDEMIQEKVERGELVPDRRYGGVRVAVERRQESLGGYPKIGGLAGRSRSESLRPGIPPPEQPRGLGLGLDVEGAKG